MTIVLLWPRLSKFDLKLSKKSYFFCALGHPLYYSVALLLHSSFRDFLEFSITCLILFDFSFRNISFADRCKKTEMDKKLAHLTLLTSWLNYLLDEKSDANNSSEILARSEGGSRTWFISKSFSNFHFHFLHF